MSHDSHDFLHKRRHLYQIWTERWTNEHIVSCLTLRVGAGGQIKDSDAMFQDISPVWQHKVLQMVNLAAFFAGTKPWESQISAVDLMQDGMASGSLIIETDVDPRNQKAWRPHVFFLFLTPIVPLRYMSFL